MTTSLSASAPASGVGFPRRRARLGLAAALVAATAVAAPQAGQPVRAETFVVTSADAGLVDPVDGSLLTLAGAVAGASDGDVITFSPSLTGFTIDAVNVPDITVDLTIDGLSGPRLTNTNGDVFTVDDPAAAVTFRNLSILDPVTGGSTPSSAFVAIDAESVEIVNAFARAVDHGARIDEADTVTITSFRVLDGAAVSISDTQDVDIDLGEFHRAPDDVGVRLENVATAEITNTELDANGSGGIVASEVDDLSLVDVDILDSGMNPGGGSATGGLEITAAGGASLVSVVDSAIAGNVGAGGGGITATGDVRLTLERSFVSANDGVDAEAIAASLTAAGATLTIVDTRIALHVDGATPTDPAPVVAVGGIGGTGDTTILRSTISGSAGTRVIEATGTTVAVSESTVTGNELTQSVIGAGPDATFDIQRSTISANESGGPAILDITSTPTTGTITVSDSIVTANGVTPLEQAVDPGAGVTVTHSLVPAASGVIGTGVVATDDPGLVNTGDNGGPTVTMLPGPDSPAVDAGDPAVALPPNATDQRGAARLVGDRIDMGSVERQESVFVETVEPARLLDTRDGENTVDGLFNGIGRRTDGQTTELQATGRAGVPTDALAVVVNVTAVGPDTVGFITVEPCLENLPLASSVNFAAGRDASNEIIARPDSDGDICIFNRSALHLVVDVVGFVPADSRYDTVGPSRFLDTRDLGQTVDDQFEGGGISEPGTEVRLPIAGRPGVPPSATTVVVNVAAVAPEDTGFVTVHPCLDERPLASSLNYEPGVNRANEIVAGLSDDGEICLFTSARTHLIVDVVGELDGETQQVPVPPARLVDTRDGNPTVDGAQEAIGRLPSGTTLVVEVGDRAGVPGDASAAVVNVTAIRPSERAFVTVWDCVGDRPLASSLNAQLANERVGNELVVGLNADGDVCLFNSVEMDLTVDVVGYLPA